MMLRLLSWPYVRKHALRTALTLVAVVIGVAVFVAMRSANAAVLATFEDTINRLAGATELQVSAGELGFGEDVLERVQSLDEVRVAAPVIEAVVGTGLPSQGNLLILGVDMTGDRSLREYDLAKGEEPLVDDPLLFLAQPDSIMVSDGFAQKNRLSLGSAVPLQTMEGPKTFTVRGILGSGGLSSAFGGNLAIMDVYAAQHVFGRGRTFSRIDLAVAKGAEIARVQQQLQEMLGPGFEVEPPAARGQSFQSLLRIYRFMLVFLSAFALLVGMFIIYNAFAISVAQRRGEIGLLRALGATRGQVWRLFVGESLIVGLIGSVLGIVLGQMGAGAMAASAASLVQGIYGVGGLNVTTALSPGVVGLALAVGVLTSGFAAAVPASSAARVDPVEALQKGRGQALEVRRIGRVAIIGAVLAVAGAALITRTDTRPPFFLGFAGVFVGTLLCAPLASLALTRGLRPLLCRIRPIEGALAFDSLIAASRRTSVTVLALMLSIALAIAIAGVAAGSYAGISGWVDTALNPDLFVTTSPTLTERNYRFPDSMTRELEAVPGIDEVLRLRNARIRMGNNPILLIALETEKTARRSPRQAVSGDLDEMFRVTAQGKGVIASENFASLRRVTLGDRIDIPSPGGVLSLPLVGVIREYSDQQGALFIDRAVFTKEWHDDGVDLFRVYVRRGVSPAKVKADILAAFSGNRRIFVLENADVRRYVSDLTDQYFTMTWAQLAVAVVVAMLGIVNSLTVSVTDRRRELGILRAVGGTRSQVRWSVWMEAIGVGLVSVVLGLVVGAIQLYCLLDLTSRDFPGLRFDYLYPYGVALAIIPTILVTAVLGALAPGESAVRSPLVEALEYE
jgi:putative ABC transport system permease protein